MGSKTYIVDTSTLIEEIYEIKGWVYSGFAGLLVPRSSEARVHAARTTADDRDSARAGRKGC